MKTLATLFSGGGLADVGFRAAGYVPVGAVEWDPAIAGCYADNHGAHVLCQPVETVDYRQWEGVDHLHASPACTTASVANQKGGEVWADVSAGLAVCRALRECRPATFSLENVWGYRNYYAFERILGTLSALGYRCRVEHLNSADVGVPQTRKRLILRAALGAMPPRWQVSHTKSGLMDWQGVWRLLPWCGWYASVEDLLPGLPESRFADWQLKRLPAGLLETLLVDGTDGSTEPAAVPVSCVTACLHAKTGMPKALLVDCVCRTGAPLTVREGAEPAPSVCASQMRRETNTVRAVLVSNAATEFSDGLRECAEPAHSVTAQHEGRLRAVVIDCQESSSQSELILRRDDEPFFTASAGTGARRPVRALLVDSAGYDDGAGRVPVTSAAEVPAGTVLANYERRALKAAVPGRVVKLDPRCLARFQSVPDTYRLPAKPGLACRIIGGGVPCLLAQRIGESLQ